MRLAIILVALTVSACAHSTPVIVPPVADPCPAEGLAAVRPEPAHPITDPIDRAKVYAAIAAAIGPLPAQALIRFWETEEPTWGRQAWERVARVKSWCEARQ